VVYSLHLLTRQVHPVVRHLEVGNALCMQQKHVRYITCQTHQVQTWRAMDHNCRYVLVFVMFGLPRSELR
jgi:hypothetical protein